MERGEFTLAATLSNLEREPDARSVADAVEFRMDAANDPLAQLAAYDGVLPIIATNRGRWFGGGANDSGRLDRLFSAAQHDAVELVDIELEIARATEWVLEDFRDAGVALLISVHVFDSTPSGEVLDALIDQCAYYGDIAKVATFAESNRDTLTLLGALSRASDRGQPVAALAMGALGSHTRVIGPLYGSAIGYAPLADDTTDYAPGQLPLDELADLIERLRRDYS